MRPVSANMAVRCAANTAPAQRSGSSGVTAVSRMAQPVAWGFLVVVLTQVRSVRVRPEADALPIAVQVYIWRRSRFSIPPQ